MASRRSFLSGLFGAFLAPTALKLSTPKPKGYWWAIPRVLSVRPLTLAGELIDVKPLSAPTGTVYFMDIAATTNGTNSIKVPRDCDSSAW